MTRRTRFICVLLSFLSFFYAVSLYAAEPKPLVPAPKDKCPVCGMFVAKFPDFLAQIHFKDGEVVFFDGAKDMFKYYFNMKRYGSGKRPDDIAAIYVTDYYSLLPVNGIAAHYCIGSNVYGPMGRELVPFEREKEALTFKKDHKGNQLLRFQGVTSALIKSLE